MTGAGGQQRGMVRRRVGQTPMRESTHHPGGLGPRPPPKRRGLLGGRWVKGHWPRTGFPLFSTGHIPRCPTPPRAPASLEVQGCLP